MYGGFDVFKIYLAIKNHFTTDYDYIKYGGKVTAKLDSFTKRPDRYFFHKLSKRFNKDDVLDYFVANFLKYHFYIWGPSQNRYRFIPKNLSIAPEYQNKTPFQLPKQFFLKSIFISKRLLFKKSNFKNYPHKIKHFYHLLGFMLYFRFTTSITLKVGIL